MTISGCAENTDRELWRKTPDDYYSPSIHVTEGGGIGITIGGFVIVKSVEWWHQMAKRNIGYGVPRWRWKLAMWLLERP